MVSSLMETIGEQTRPAQIRYHREKYNQYKIQMETDGESAKKFEDWLQEQGIDHRKLLYNEKAQS